MSGRGTKWLAAGLLLAAGGLWLSRGASDTAQTRGQSDGAGSAAERRPAAASVARAVARPAPPAGHEPEARGPGGDRPASATTQTSTAGAPPTGVLEQLTGLRDLESQMGVSAYLDKNAALAAEKVEDYCGARARLPPHPIGAPPEGALDAADFMRPLSDWHEPKRQGKLHLPDALMARLGGANDRWLSAVQPGDFAGRDFSWMRVLSQYGTWNLLEGPAAGEGPDSLAVQLPNYVTLLAWVKLRLAHALVAGDLAGASRDVRHLAGLLNSQKVMLADIFALIMLQMERYAYDAALARGLDVRGWAEPMSQETLLEHRRLVRVMGSFFMPGVAPEVMDRARECTPDPCMALNEAAWVEASVGALSPERTDEAFWRHFEAAGCSPAFSRRLRDNRQMTLEFARRAFDTEPALARWPMPR